MVWFRFTKWETWTDPMRPTTFIHPSFPPSIFPVTKHQRITKATAAAAKAWREEMYSLEITRSAAAVGGRSMPSSHGQLEELFG